MNETFKFIWISPIISQQEIEGLFNWVNVHLTELSLKPLISFSKMDVQFLSEPAEALRLEFEVVNLGAPHSVELFKEAIWSELLVGSHPGPKPYAISLQPESVRRLEKKLVCFDMDSTLIDQEVIDEIARTLGFYDQVAEITELAMQGKLDFKESLKKRVWLFNGMPKAQAESIIPHLTVSPGGEKLLSSLRFKGVKTAVVSGGFEFILKHFQKTLFLDQVYGNVLTTDDDEKLTGEVEDPVVDADYKRKLVARLKENYQVPLEQTVVIGDGANDIPMMKEAAISVSFCGKPKLTPEVNTLILDRNLFWIKELI